MALPSHAIQKLVVSGYKTDRCRYLVLTVQQPAAVRRFLRALLDGGWVVSAAGPQAHQLPPTPPPPCPVSIGLSFAGLQQLGLPTAYQRILQDHAPAFTQGAPRRAAHRLADTGPSAAESWEAPFQPQAAHIFLALHADGKDTLQQCHDRLQALSGDAFTPQGWHTPLDGKHLAHHTQARRVHFGFLDGITNPLIDGIHPRRPPPDGQRVPPRYHAPGEFLLGHPNDDGYNRWLLAAEPAPVRQFFAHGSFCAFRKMAQDEGAFQQFVNRSASALQRSAEYVRAKLLGRWDDGQVVSASAPDSPPGNTPRSNAGLNDFDFRQDPHGLGCPFGAHIRRMNPRSDPVVPLRKRPLLRRGIPYGRAFTDATAQEERGLLGLFFCASLEDQFEHLLAEWGNKNPFGTAIRGDAKDPIVGNHEGHGGSFDIPGGPTVTGFTPFVTTRGTLYTLFPSLPALAMLADGIEEEIGIQRILDGRN